MTRRRGTQAPPTAEGGALRAQSVRRPPGEPRDLGGTIIRVNPSTGSGLPSNPMASSTDANARRIVAAGLRNPYRFVIRSGELWIAEVGQANIEEIDRDAHPLDSHVKNFGWPCYEGANPQPNYKALGLNICNGLYSHPGTAFEPVLRVQAREPGGSRRELPHWRLGDQRPGLLSKRTLSGGVRRGAVLR